MKIIGLKQKVGVLLASLMVISGVFGIVNTTQIFSLRQVEETVKKEFTETKQNSSSTEVAMMMDCPGLNFTCKEVNLSLDAVCKAKVDPLMFLHITPSGLPADTFIVMVTDSITGQVHPDSFDITDIGRVFKVKISVKGCNNAPCWSRLLIEDKMPPVVYCDSDTINCTDDFKEYITYDAIDNCGIKKTDTFSVYRPILCTNPESRLYLGYFDVKIIVTDYYNMKDSCTERIYVRRPNLDNIQVPRPATVECGSYRGKYPPESLTGFLTLDGNRLTASSRELCMAELNRTDTILSPSTSCNKILRRDWELIIWTCGAPIIRKYTQIITIEDTTPPEISEVEDLTIDLTTPNCIWKGKIPAIQASDCNQDKIQYEVIYPGGSKLGNAPELQLGPGMHKIVYNVTDGVCGNASKDSFNLVILDKVSPVALCASPIVAITSTGKGILTAKDVNKGSYDYCGAIKSIKIQRMEKTCNFDTLWRDTVTYCCSDVGRPDLMVALRVEDTSGNFNICMAPVTVQNKIVPDATYPDDTTVTCSFPIDLNNLGNAFGRPRLLAECPNNASIDTIYEDKRDMCGLGRIVRTFGLRYQGIVIETVTQTIYIDPDYILQPSDVDWPEEEVMAQLGKTDTSFTGRPAWPNLPCNVIGMSMKDDTLGTAQAGTCFKIERTFKIINWCGPNKNVVDPEFTFKQIIKVVDSVGPTITTLDTLRTICSFADNCNATELARLTAKATDNGPQSDLNWVYTVDLNKDGSVNFSGIGDSVAVQAPIGRHSVTFKVTDACGSSDEITYDFIVKNCKGPVAKCINLVTVPMGGPAGMVEVCAKSFNVRSEDICSDTSALLYTFDSAYPVRDSITKVHYFKGNGQLATLAEYNAGTAQKWDPVNKTSCRIVRCSSIRTFNMSVWDTDRNEGVCQVTLTLEGCCVDVVSPVISTSDSTRRFINPFANCDTLIAVALSAAATDAGTPQNRLKWSFELDRGNNSTVDSSGTANSFTTRLPVGTHKVKFTVEDTCFNSSMIMYLIEIRNDKGPRAVCRDTLRITLLSSPGMASMYTLSARELDNPITRSTDSCSTDSLVYTFGGTFPVRDSILKVHYFTGNGVPSTEAAYLAGNAFRWNPTTRSAQIKLGCGNVGTFSRTLRVWDPTLKFSECNTTIVLTGECPASIGDFVWEDLNGNGIQDNGEPGIPNVRVRLLSGTNVILDSLLTDSNGRYCFDSLNAGTYRVQFVAPTGFLTTTRNAAGGTAANNSDPVVSTGITDAFMLATTQSNKDIDAGYIRFGAIGDLVWRDNNSNGRQDAGEAGVPNVRVVLQNNAGVAIDSLLTDANGKYCFDSLTPATYRVLFRTPAGFTITTSNAASVNDTLDSDPVNGLVTNIVINSGQNNKSIDAGFIPPANLCENHAYTGFMVGTCTAYTGTNAPVAVIYDVRQNQSVNRSRNWAPPQIMGSNWTIDSIGQVFGIATDDSANVYLSHTDVYLIQNNQPANIPPGRIYKARPPLFRAEVFTTLPNAGGAFNGIGNIVYDRKHNQLFATNLEDGKIYRISNTGNVIDSYDPFAVDNGTNGIAVLSEQVWGIGINYEGSQTKLYFPRIGPGTSRRMYSLTLTAAGAFPAIANSEVVVINNLPGDEVRITDVAFDHNGTRMLWAERGGVNKYPREIPITEGSHTSIAAQYNLTGGVWTFNKVFSVGSNVDTELPGGSGNTTPAIDGENSAGGVDFGFRQKNGDPLAGRDEIGWYSGNWLHKGNRYIRDTGDDSLYYGAQAIVFDSVGNVRRDIVIDFDNNGTNFDDKGQIGDVEVFRCRFTPGSQLIAIAGSVATPSDDMVEGVEINLQERRNDGIVTNSTGTFEVHHLEQGGNYTVIPYKNDDVNNGINVLDLLHLQRHILGINRLTSPYKLIAGDVDNDQKISISDIVALRKVILGVENNFVNNTSWRFVDKNQNLDSNNPWKDGLKESVEFSDLSANGSALFTGVKIGDIDGNALANSTSLQKRSVGRQHLIVERTTGNGTVKVPVYTDATEYSALDISFRLNGWSLKEVVSGQVEVSNENIIALNGSYKMLAWTTREKVINSEEALFYLVLEGKNEFSAADISLTSMSKVYSDEQEANLSLKERSGNSASKIQTLLHQNYPNPWDNTTKIVFELPKDAEVQFTVFDATGKKVMEQHLNGVNGINELTIHAHQLPMAGMYNYSIRYENSVLNKRFILINK